MTWPVYPMFLQNRVPILSSRRTLRFACPRHQTTYLKKTKTRYGAQPNDHSGLMRPGLVTADSRSPLSEAERLLEEQMRLLEMERENSLSIARQCSARSKRLIARLDNLKEYRAMAAARRGFTGATREPDARRASPRRKASRLNQDVGAWTGEATGAAAGTQFRGFGRAPEQQLTSNRGRRKAAAGVIGDEGQAVSGQAGDPEEDQVSKYTQVNPKLTSRCDVENLKAVLQLSSSPSL
ncbi:hypothetical protein Vafri_9940 [Volvox africanus]|uniref:Uncharacterized protein n=1 Tax=Volvox africanus TaxID=51714 RepID=A0A8J4B5A2_9CHLO|nr:hypothetical protein Vafri_9940 [Volvox africanus]